MDCLVATLSVDPVKSHNEWLRDVVAHCENEITVDFPIIGDSDRSISTAYGMIDPGTSDDQDLPLTIRAVFIINPENKLMLSLNYPACVGRNTDEIVRCVKALQLSYEKSIATPANWPMNHADIPLADGTRTDEFKGSVFLLPTVSTGLNLNVIVVSFPCLSMDPSHSMTHFFHHFLSRSLFLFVCCLFPRFFFPGLARRGQGQLPELPHL